MKSTGFGIVSSLSMCLSGPALQLRGVRVKVCELARCGRAMPSIGAITWEQRECEHAVTYRA